MGRVHWPHHDRLPPLVAPDQRDGCHATRPRYLPPLLAGAELGSLYQNRAVNDSCAPRRRGGRPNCTLASGVVVAAGHQVQPGANCGKPREVGISTRSQRRHDGSRARVTSLGLSGSLGGAGTSATGKRREALRHGFPSAQAGPSFSGATTRWPHTSRTCTAIRSIRQSSEQDRCTRSRCLIRSGDT
jgi:hypothetical protein